MTVGVIREDGETDVNDHSGHGTFGDIADDGAGNPGGMMIMFSASDVPHVSHEHQAYVHQFLQGPL